MGATPPMANPVTARTQAASGAAEPDSKQGSDPLCIDPVRARGQDKHRARRVLCRAEDD